MEVIKLPSQRIQIHGDGVTDFPERPNLFCNLNYNDITRRSDGVALAHITSINIEGTHDGQHFEYMIRVLARITGGSWVPLLEKVQGASTWTDITGGPFDITGNTNADTVTFEIGVQANCTCHTYLVESEIYAVWSTSAYIGPITHTYTFNPNGGSGGPISATKTKGVDFTFPSEIPTWAGHGFTGWNNTEINGGQLYQPNQTVGGLPDSDITWWANWKVLGNYTISYNANGGSGAPGNQVIETGSSVTLSSTTPIRSIRITFNPNGGSISPTYRDITTQFSHWNTAANGSGTSYSPGQTFTPTSNITLYAIYSSAQVGTLPTPSRTQCIYVGWYTSIDGGSSVSNSTQFSSSTTIYARYNYIIIYNTGSAGIYLANQTKIHGQNLTLYDITISDDNDPSHVFAGWSTTSGSSTAQYQAGSVYSANAPATLYIVWKPNPQTFLVTFDLQGGTYQGGGALEQNVRYGQSAVLPNDPTRAGKVFCGWLGDYTYIDSDRTIKALWNTSPIWIFTGTQWIPLP